MAFAAILKKIESGEDLSADEATGAFNEIFAGTVAEVDIGRFLMALNKKGETVDEISGAVASMRSNAINKIKVPENTIDICGTGGDGLGTLNVSTAAAIVAASCGVPVAKHGNRGVSSLAGSSDILSILGVKLAPAIEVQERCLKEANICFLFAPHHHPAMRHVAEVRKTLGVRTIFNILGPLTNPANVKRHLIGVFELEWLGPMAEVLRQGGSEEAWLAHGQDGMDEITTTAPTDVVELRHNLVRHFALTPEELGLHRAKPDDLKGQDTLFNANALRRLLQGEVGPYRDIVLMNAAAALAVAGKSDDLRGNCARAADAIDSGSAKHTLDTLVKITNGLDT